MHYDDIQLGDTMKILQDSGDYSRVVEPFVGRIGRVSAMLKTRYGEHRVLIAFDDGKNNDLWFVSQTGEYKTMEVFHFGLYSGEE